MQQERRREKHTGGEEEKIFFDVSLAKWLTNDHFLNVNYFTMKWIFLRKKRKKDVN